MTRIRVARIITRLNVGGPAIQAMLLTERLDPARFDTLLISGVLGSSEGDMQRFRPGTSRTPLLIPTLRREVSLSADPHALVMIATLRAFRPDVVHTHLSKAGLLGRIAARIAGAPVVVHTFHGILRGYFDPLREAVFLSLERGLARLSTRVIAPSPRQRAEIERLGIARGEKIVDIPLGLELAPFLDPPRGRLRRELGLDGNVRLVGIAARLVPIKRIDVFIEAARRIGLRRQDVRFVIVGDGEERGRLEQQSAAAGLGGRVSFLGWRGDMPAIYADLDVVALTSDNEGTSVSILEALAAGRPVVATAVGGVPDVLGANERGLLVARGDEDAMAGGILKLLDEPDLAAHLATTGRAHVYPEHDAKTLVERISDLYEDLLSRRR